MKTAFAAALALSLLSGTAFAAPSDMRGNQSQNHQGQTNQNKPTQGKPVQNKPAQAQSRPSAPQGAHQQSRDDHRNDRGGNDRHYGNNDRSPSRNYEYNGRRYQAVRGPAWHAPRGYDARRAWNRGDRLPSAYRDRAYVIDYRAYGLMRPAYGYQWVRVSNNVFLVNANNGLISQIVFSMFY